MSTWGRSSKEPAEPDIGIDRQRDAGEINDARADHGFGDASPVWQFEQLAGRRAFTPEMRDAVARRSGFNQAEAGEAARHARDEFGGNAFRRSEREDLVGIGIVAECACESDRQPAASEINRRIESVAGAGLPEASVRSARHLDHDFADGKDEAAGVAHGLDRKKLRKGGVGCTMARYAPIWQRNRGQGPESEIRFLFRHHTSSVFGIDLSEES